MALARHPGRKPTHPGALLREVILPALNRPKSEVAALLTVSRESLYRLLNEQQPVSPTMAAKLGKLLGNGTGFWLRMQATYDTWHAENTVDVSRIPTLEEA